MQGLVSYPDSDCYLVTYPGGTGGSLVVTLLSCFLIKEEQLHFYFPSDRGNFHSILEAIEQFWNEETKRKWYTEKFVYKKDINIYDYITPKQLDQPLILHQHDHVSDYNQLQSIYPKFLEFIISTEPEDSAQINLNLFLKLIADTPYRNYSQHEDTFKEQWINYREDWLDKNPEELWINEYSSAKELVDNKDDFKRFALLNNNWNRPLAYHFDVEAELQRIIEIAGDCSSKITFLKFHDIHYNPEKILNQFSETLKIPVPEVAKQKYDAWLNKQILIEHLLGE